MINNFYNQFFILKNKKKSEEELKNVSLNYETNDSEKHQTKR